MAPDAPLLLAHCGFGEGEEAAEAAHGVTPPEWGQPTIDGDADHEAPLSLGQAPSRFTRSAPWLYRRMHSSPAALRRVTAEWETMWSASAIAAVHARAMLDRLYAVPIRKSEAERFFSGQGARRARGTAATGAVVLDESDESLPWGEALAQFGGKAAMLALSDAEYTIAGVGAAGASTRYVPLASRPRAHSLAQRLAKKAPGTEGQSVRHTGSYATAETPERGDSAASVSRHASKSETDIPHS